MSAWKLVASTLSSPWRAAQPEIVAGPLLAVEAITDTWARRIVGRAKRRFELTNNPAAAAIANEDTYIATACSAGQLKGFCFVAADEMTQELNARGANAQCVRVQKQGGSDHYFTVVNKGSAKNSLIVDATWLQFALAAPQFCLAGTLDKVKAALKRMNTAPELADAYRAGLEVVNQWGAYDCFQ